MGYRFQNTIQATYDKQDSQLLKSGTLYKGNVQIKDGLIVLVIDGTEFTYTSLKEFFDTWNILDIT